MDQISLESKFSFQNYLDGPEDAMNVFILAEDQSESCQYYTNSHTIKIILELAQLLSNGYREHFPNADHSFLYKETHKNHPWSIFARESIHNWKWLFSMFLKLNAEYSYRYNRLHASFEKFYDTFSSAISTTPSSTDSNLDFPLCMPEQYRIPGDPVASYRAYYLGEKQHLFDWKKRTTPWWIQANIMGIAA